MEYVISIVIVTIFTVIGYFAWSHRKNKLYWQKRGVPYPSDFSLKNFLKILRVPVHEIFAELYKKYGRIYGTFELRIPTLTVCEPDLLRDILIKDFHIFHSRLDFDFGDKIANSMVSLLKGEDWKRVRTIITPAFTSRRMRQISRIINECSNSIIKTLEKHAESGEPADCKSIFGAFTLDVIAKSAFATKIDSLNDPENIFVKNAKSIFSKPATFRLLAIVFLPFWIVRKLRLLVSPANEFFKNTILNVIKERKETGKKYDDMLQLFMEAQEEYENEKAKETSKSDAQEDEIDRYGSVTHTEMMPRLKYKKLSEDELVAQCILFFFVGYETTASTLAFMAYSLALNPECQEKLIAEVDETFEKHKEINYDAVRDMKYLDLVISETLRMFPIAPRSQRTAFEDYKLGNTGITIDKGTIVAFDVYSMHYDPQFFPNPQNFYPERFLNENVTHPQYAYLPFGAGPRNCLGMRFALMEMKLCISHILRNYKFKTAETTKIPLEYKIGVGLLSVDHLPLTIERRSVK